MARRLPSNVAGNSLSCVRCKPRHPIGIAEPPIHQVSRSCVPVSVSYKPLLSQVTNTYTQGRRSDGYHPSTFCSPGLLQGVSSTFLIISRFCVPLKHVAPLELHPYPDIGHKTKMGISRVPDFLMKRLLGTSRSSIRPNLKEISTCGKSTRRRWNIGNIFKPSLIGGGIMQTEVRSLGSDFDVTICRRPSSVLAAQAQSRIKILEKVVSHSRFARPYRRI